MLCSSLFVCLFVFVLLFVCLFTIYIFVSSAHSPDNSFLGFVVGKFKRNATPPVKKNIAVVYGKEHYMWKVSGCGLEGVGVVWNDWKVRDA